MVVRKAMAKAFFVAALNVAQEAAKGGSVPRL
jgi:hypothetical protein